MMGIPMKVRLTALAATSAAILAFGSGTASASTLPVPVGGVGAPSITQTACPAAGDCVAIGTYSTDMGQFALIDTETDGVWSAANAPTPANAYTEMPAVSLAAISCPSVSRCFIIGSYQAQSAEYGIQIAAFVDTETDGVWSLSEPPVPGIVVPDEMALTSILCTSDTSCLAAGFYDGSDGGVEYDGYWDGYTRGYLVRLANGKWTTADVKLPGSAPFEMPNVSGDGSTISCPQSGACSVTEGYENPNAKVGQNAFYTVKLGVPRPVAKVKVALAGRTATVAWKATSDKVALSGYTVTATDLTTPSAQVRTVQTSTKARAARFTSLTRGHRYRFTVTATNILGAGKSASVSVRAPK